MKHPLIAIAPLLKVLGLPLLAALFGCAAPAPESPPETAAADPEPRQPPLDRRQNGGPLVLSPAAPGHIDSTLLLDRERASLSLRATLAPPPGGRGDLSVQGYKLQFRYAGGEAVAISEVELQTQSRNLPVEMGRVVVPSGGGHIFTIARADARSIDPHSDTLLVFRYDGRRFQAVIHRHQLVYVLEQPR